LLQKRLRLRFGCGKCWCGENCNRVDFVYGFRYYGFNDNLGIREQLTSFDPGSGVAIGTQIDVRDSFVTQNNFYGGEIGLIGQHLPGRWMFEDTLKVALGDRNNWFRSTAVHRQFSRPAHGIQSGRTFCAIQHIGRGPIRRVKVVLRDETVANVNLCAIANAAAGAIEVTVREFPIVVDRIAEAVNKIDSVAIFAAQHFPHPNRNRSRFCSNRYSSSKGCSRIRCRRPSNALWLLILMRPTTMPGTAISSSAAPVVASMRGE